MLRTAGLNLQEWVVVIVGALIIIPVGLLRKLIFSSHRKLEGEQAA